MPFSFRFVKTVAAVEGGDWCVFMTVIMRTDWGNYFLFMTDFMHNLFRRISVFFKKPDADAVQGQEI